MIIVHGLQDKSRTGGGDASARLEPRLGDGSQLSVHGLQRRVAVRKQQQFCHNRVWIRDAFSNHKALEYFMETFLYPHITVSQHCVIKW